MAWAPHDIFCLTNSYKSSFFSINNPPSSALIFSNTRQFQQNLILFSSISVQVQNNISFKTQLSSLSSRTDSFVGKIEDKSDLNSIQLLENNGDWSKEQFWDFINFLRINKRTDEVLQVFDEWKKREISRINVDNHEKIIGILLEERLTDEAASALAQMKTYGLNLSIDMYNGLIHGFSKKGNFDVALSYLKEMKEYGLMPNAETYNGLIQAYGKFGMYDEIGSCLKEMKSVGSSPDHITYNLLIREFAKAGLLKKMESTHRTLFSKRMELQSSTLISMLKAYIKFRICDKMEKCAIRVLKSNANLNDDLIRKVAEVYIEKHMFSRLEELGHGLSLRNGSTDLVWCLRMLSNACICSRNCMHSIIHEMELNKVPWNVTIANIMSLSYLKMKDFKHLNIVLSELPFRLVQPDIVTIGILSDACCFGFDGARVKGLWKRSGYFLDKVKMKTDPLVLTAFGKGQFLTDFEEMYTSIDFKSKVRNWDYQHLIEVVDTHKKYKLLAKNGSSM